MAWSYNASPRALEGLPYYRVFLAYGDTSTHGIRVWRHIGRLMKQSAGKNVSPSLIYPGVIRKQDEDDLDQLYGQDKLYFKNRTSCVLRLGLWCYPLAGSISALKLQSWKWISSEGYVPTMPVRHPSPSCFPERSCEIDSSDWFQPSLFNHSELKDITAMPKVN